MTVPDPPFDHLLEMTDGLGTYEHADHAAPRRDHGYCTDDVARVLIAVCREPAPTVAETDMAHVAMRFLIDAQDPSGSTRNRRTVDGRWRDEHAVEDPWGRSVWAFGTAAVRAPVASMRQRALAAFDGALQQRSPWPRSMAFAGLGAAEVAAVLPTHSGARSLLADAIEVVGAINPDPAWPWPEHRLTYANAAIAEVLIAAGAVLDRPRATYDGLRLLHWLLERETRDDHLSPTPAGGSAGPLDGPSFDQQPIEVAAMADACARAAAVTGESQWMRGVAMAVNWFLGDNDAGAVMWDPVTAGGYDGLQPNGANLNQGTESTLAFITTLQYARNLSPLAS